MTQFYTKMFTTKFSNIEEWWCIVYRNDNFEKPFRHREDGPAIIFNNGTQEWYKNGLRHREDGPAIVRYNGDMEWWLNGKVHREDGPAVIFNDDYIEWWLNGKLIITSDDVPAPCKLIRSIY